jgi:hypothetical protein
MQGLTSPNNSTPRSRNVAAKHKKIAIEARSLLDLQLKLAKHPSWRILEISRLNFGFKVVLQKKPIEDRRRLSDDVSHRALINREVVSLRRSSL